MTAGRRRPHALELIFDDVDDRDVRALWGLLEEAGLPSSARHQGSTHRPHVTVVSGARPEQLILALAARTWAPLLPVALPRDGLIMLGSRRLALAEALEASRPVRQARERIAAQWPDADSRPWMPHVTLAPRLTPEQLAQAEQVLADRNTPDSWRAVGLRWWDPDQGAVTRIC